jgi:hypothetical protein
MLPHRSAIIALMLIGIPLARAHTADEVLRYKTRLHGHVISVEGFVRFDHLSQRGFLYRNLIDMRRRNYRKTIFLELGNERFSSLRIPDGSYVVATGYLSEKLRGPLGVYPAHIIVDRVKVLRKKTAASVHSVERLRPNQAMQRTPSKAAIDVLRVCRPRFGSVARCSGLAVADLVSR